jgi:hypothetical protein
MLQFTIYRQNKNKYIQYENIIPLLLTFKVEKERLQSVTMVQKHFRKIMKSGKLAKLVKSHQI